MGTTGSLNEISQLIHLAVAPIFLLTGVATTLMVFANRLARIVDRGRYLESRPISNDNHRKGELRMLERRARLIYRALSLGVLAALGVCFLMTLAFVGALFGLNTAGPVALLFLLSLFTYTAALLCLLREVFLAVDTFKLGLHEATREL